MDLSIHHSKTIIYVPPNGNMISLREVKLLHGSVLQIQISVLNVSYEKTVGCKLLFKSINGKRMTNDLKAVYLSSEKNPEDEFNKPNLDIFELKYDMTQQISNRVPWSPIINLIPYYSVNGQYYRDNEIERKESDINIDPGCATSVICKDGYTFRVQIVSKFESDLAWELLEKEAGLDKTNQAKKDLLIGNPNNSNKSTDQNYQNYTSSSKGASYNKNNEIFWEINFREAVKEAGGTQREWNRLCHGGLSKPEDKKITNYRQNKAAILNSIKQDQKLSDYDYCVDVKNNHKVDSSFSWKIQGCEEFYQQDMNNNPYAFIPTAVEPKTATATTKTTTTTTNTITTTDKLNNTSSTENITHQENKPVPGKKDKKTANPNNHPSKNSTKGKGGKRKPMDVNRLNKTEAMSNEIGKVKH